MDLTPKKIWKQIVQYWSKQSKKMKTVFTVSILGICFAAIIITVILNHDAYVVLYRGLSSSEAGEIITRLEEMGVDSKIKDDGSILVPENEEARLKMLLASEGYPQSTLNYDIFSDNSDFTTTDYEKKKYLIFQLQNRLQDAIKTLSGVKNAIVTISVSDDSSFVLQEDKVPTTASVLLELNGSSELGKKQINGIAQLVAKSVPGLDTKDVAIVDDTGMILNNTDTDESTAFSNTRMELENTISDTIKNKIINLLYPVFGRSRISVAVNTSIELNKKISEQTTYTPVIDQSGIVAKQDQTKEVQGSDSVASGVPGTDSNTEVATYPVTDDNASEGSSSESSSTDYLVNQLKEQVEHDGYEIKDVSVAVIIGDDSLTQEEISGYREMVAYAAGISADKVLVSGIEFATQSSLGDEIETSASKLLEIVHKYPIFVLGAALLLVLIIVVLIIVLVKRRKKRKVEPEEEEGPDIQTLLEAKGEKIPGEIILNETREQGLQRQIRELSSTNPSIVAQLLRTWIKEDENG